MRAQPAAHTTSVLPLSTSSPDSKGRKIDSISYTDMEIICTELLAKDVTVNEYAWEERKAEKRAEDRPLRKNFMLKKRKRRQ